MLYRFVSVACCLLLTIQMIEVSAVAQQSSTASGSSQDSVASCKQPCLEDGTPIKLRISQTVSSADAHVDDRVQFEVLEEIKNSDVVIVPKGGIAWGTVTEAQPKRRMARGGKLEIVMDSVRLADGEKAALRATKGGSGGGHTGAMTAGIVATALVCFVCAPLFLLMHGKDITIPKGTEIPTFVNGNLPLELAKFQETPSPSQQVQTKLSPSGVPPTSVDQAQRNGDAQVEVASVPSGADVELDGNFVGNTPSTIGVSSGDHTVRVKKSGYKLWERKLQVNGGNINIAAELESEKESEASQRNIDTAARSTTSAPPGPSRDTSKSSPETLVMIYLASDPDGAEINIDDAPVGKAPMTVKLKPGRHAFRMFMNSYQNWVQWITIEPGTDVHVKATLTKSNE